MDLQRKTKIRDSLIIHRAAQFAFLSELIRIETVHQPGDFAPACERVAELFEGLGFKVERIAVPTSPLSGDQRGHTQRTGISNLVVRHGFGPGPVIALVAHGDTAPPIENEQSSAFNAEIENGIMHGNGAISKGNIAAYAFALMALQKTAKGLKGTVELHISFDGEGDGSSGVERLLEKSHVNPDQAIVSGALLHIATSGCGSIELEAEMTGRLVTAPSTAAKPGSSTKPNDALFAVSKVLEALFKEKQASAQTISTCVGVGAAELTVTKINADRGPRTLPERAAVQFKRTVLPDEDPARVQAHLTRVVGRASVGANGVVCKVRRLSLAKSFGPQAMGQNLLGIIKKQTEESLGFAVDEIGVADYTDGRHYAKLGIPVLLFGVNPSVVDDGLGVQLNEHLKLDDLRKVTEIVALGLAEFLSDPD